MPFLFSDNLNNNQANIHWYSLWHLDILAWLCGGFSFPICRDNCGTSQMALVVKNPPAHAGDTRDSGPILGSGRSPGVGNGTHSCILAWKNSMDRGASWATVYGVKKSWTRLSTNTHTHTQYELIVLLLLFSHSIMSNSLRPHGLQHARLPCPSQSSQACSNSCPLSRWGHPTILSSVLPFSCLQFFPASEGFLMSQLFTSGGQSTGASASASALPMNIQNWFPLGWTGWISLQSEGLSRVFSNTTVQKHQLFGTQPSLWSKLSHPYMTTGKTIALTRWAFVGKVMSLLFNMLSMFVKAFLPSSKRLISWLQSLSTVILEPKKIKKMLIVSKSWNQTLGISKKIYSLAMACQACQSLCLLINYYWSCSIW